MGFLKKKKFVYIVLFAIFLTAAAILSIGKIVLAQGLITTGLSPEEISSAGRVPAATASEEKKGGGGIIGGITSTAVEYVATAMGYIFGWIASVLFGIGGFLIQIALDLNKDLLNSPTISIGWNIVLNITNLGFVLAIIIMAFATIFQLQSYAMKQTLWKLIVAALLVNFSLFIAGAFIDVANTFTEYLKDRAVLNGVGSFPESFASILKVQGLLNVQDIINSTGGGTVGSLTAAGLSTLSSVFFIAFFTLLGAIALLATAVMLLIRYIALGMLLILSPIVWLLWIFPATQSHWKKWWTTFLDWTFFAPAVLFFLYLAILTMRGHESYFNKITEDAARGIPIRIDSGLSVIGNLVIVLGLIFGGLIVAKSLSGSGGTFFYGAAQGAAKAFGGWAGRVPLRAGAGALRRTGIGQRVTQGIQQRVQQWQANHPGQPLPRRLNLLQRAGGTIRRATVYRAPGLLPSVIAGLRRRGRPEMPPDIRRQRLQRIREINQEVTALQQALAQLDPQQQQQVGPQIQQQINQLQGELQQVLQQLP